MALKYHSQRKIAVAAAKMAACMYTAFRAVANITELREAFPASFPKESGVLHVEFHHDTGDLQQCTYWALNQIHYPRPLTCVKMNTIWSGSRRWNHFTLNSFEEHCEITKGIPVHGTFSSTDFQLTEFLVLETSSSGTSITRDCQSKWLPVQGN